ncbi:MAG: hypothetical protein V3573_04085 [Desulfovibrionaceae bacterium]
MRLARIFYLAACLVGLVLCAPVPGVAVDAAHYMPQGFLDDERLDKADFTELSDLANHFLGQKKYDEYAQVMTVFLRHARFGDLDTLEKQAVQALNLVMGQVRAEAEAKLADMRAAQAGWNYDALESAMASVNNSLSSLESAQRSIQAFESEAAALQARYNEIGRQLAAQPLNHWIKNREAMRVALAEMTALRDEACGTKDAAAAREAFRKLSERSASYDGCRNGLDTWKRDVSFMDASLKRSATDAARSEVDKQAAVARKAAGGFAAQTASLDLEGKAATLEQALDHPPDTTRLNALRQDMLDLSHSHEKLADPVTPNGFMHERSWWDDKLQRAVQIQEGSDSMQGRIQTLVRPHGKPSYAQRLRLVRGYDPADVLAGLDRSRGTLDAVLNGAGEVNRNIFRMDALVREARECVVNVAQQQTAEVRQQPSPPAPSDTPPGEPSDTPPDNAADRPGDAPPAPVLPAPATTSPAAPLPGTSPTDIANQDNVFGGLVLDGPARIGQGQSWTYRGLDHGGRQYSGLRFVTSNSTVLEMGPDGRARALAPGKATLMVRKDSMVAYLDVTVVATVVELGPEPGPAPPVPAALDAPEQPDTSGPVVDAGSGADQPTGHDTALLPEESVDPPGGSGGGSGPGSGSGPGGGTGGGTGSGPLPFTFNTRPLNVTSVGISSTGYHAFATGSRLGWAAALSRYSIGPSDPAIIEHLQIAKAHVEAAYSNSLGPIPAWKNYQSINAGLDQRIAQLRKVAADPQARYREQLAVSLGGLASSLADQIGWQYAGQPVKKENCESNYTRLGYHLGYAHQGLMIAREAEAQGAESSMVNRIHADARIHLNTALRILADMPKVQVFTGRCADLARALELTRTAWNKPPKDYAAQADAARQAWDEALRAIQAMGGGGGTTGPGVTAQPAPLPQSSGGLDDFYVAFEATFLGARDYPEWFSETPPKDAPKSQKDAFWVKQRARAEQWARSYPLDQAVELGLTKKNNQPQVIHVTGRGARDFPSTGFVAGEKWAMPVDMTQSSKDGQPTRFAGSFLFKVRSVHPDQASLAAAGVDLKKAKFVEIKSKDHRHAVTEKNSQGTMGPLRKGWSEEDRRGNFMLTTFIAVAMSQLGVGLEECFTESVATGAGLNPALLDPLRRLRNEVLAQSTQGRRLTVLYYQSSPMLKRLLANAPGLRPFAGLGLVRLSALLDGPRATGGIVSDLMVRGMDFLAVAARPGLIPQMFEPNPAGEVAGVLEPFLSRGLGPVHGPLHLGRYAVFSLGNN